MGPLPNSAPAVVVFSLSQAKAAGMAARARMARAEAIFLMRHASISKKVSRFYGGSGAGSNEKRGGRRSRPGYPLAAAGGGPSEVPDAPPAADATPDSPVRGVPGVASAARTARA